MGQIRNHLTTQFPNRSYCDELIRRIRHKARELKFGSDGDCVNKFNFKGEQIRDQGGVFKTFMDCKCFYENFNAYIR